MRTATSKQPQVVFGPYGSGPAVAAIRATDRAVWNHGGATDRLRRPSFQHAINVLAPASSYFTGALQAIRAADPDAHTVSLLHATTGFGREVAAGAIRTGGLLGFEVRATAFAPGQAAAAALPTGDVLMVAGGFADELAAARVLVARPWRAAAFVGAGVEEVLAPLGPARDGLLGPCQWLAHVAPPPEEGPDAGWFVSAFRESVGHEPPYPAAAAFAAGVLCARCLREVGEADDAALLGAAARLSVRTLFGCFRLDSVTGIQAGHEVLTVQWQGGTRCVVWPPKHTERALAVLGTRNSEWPPS
jgi:branched-chain amino acid transport system substrate-binding protein